MSLLSVTAFRDRVIAGALLGLDWGEKSIGVALSTPNWSMALPLCTLARKPWMVFLSAFTRMAQEHKIVGLVVGWPLQMDGSEGENCRKVSEFITLLSRTCDWPVCLWDERLSTQGVTHWRLPSTKKDDPNAAAFMLQGALDFLRTVPYD